MQGGGSRWRRLLESQADVGTRLAAVKETAKLAERIRKGWLAVALKPLGWVGIVWLPRHRVLASWGVCCVCCSSESWGWSSMFHVFNIERGMAGVNLAGPDDRIRPPLLLRLCPPPLPTPPHTHPLPHQSSDLALFALAPPSQGVSHSTSVRPRSPHLPTCFPREHIVPLLTHTQVACVPVVGSTRVACGGGRGSYYATCKEAPWLSGTARCRPCP